MSCLGSLRLGLAGLLAFASGAAVAAETFVRMDPWPTFVRSPVRWDGVYVGANWGYSFGRARWSNPAGLFALDGDLATTGPLDGLFGGAQIGYNRQVGHMVFGVEGDVDFGALTGNANCGAVVGVGGFGDVCRTEAAWTGSATGRLGYVAGRSLSYVKGGVAYDHDKFFVANKVLFPQSGFPPFDASRASPRVGWTVGAGVEYALDTHWSARAEYDYYHFQPRGLNFRSPLLPTLPGQFDTAVSRQVVKFGLNYRIGAGAPSDSSGPPAINDVTSVFGMRAGYSSGRFQKKLFDNFATSQLNSRLTWVGQAGLAVEAFGRLEHRSGLFVKGLIGGVDIASSHMNDEDFPPIIIPYSNTQSASRDGRDFYATADLGYTFLRGYSYKLGGLVGYNVYSQQMNAYGCTQVGGGDVCVPAGSIASDALGLSETERWQSVRLGLAGDAMVLPHVRLSVDAAWLPIMWLDARDNHWARPDINPLPESGHGSNGYQLESALSYVINDRFTVGVGARYWSFNAKGGTTFPFAGAQSPEKFESSRLTTFVQATYRFGG